MHHALMNICEPVLEKLAIADSYACRKGKGRLKAIERGQGFARQYGWFLQMDIRKYFESIRHDILLSMLERRFKDRELLKLFARIVASDSSRPGRG